VDIRVRMVDCGLHGGLWVTWWIVGYMVGHVVVVQQCARERLSELNLSMHNRHTTAKTQVKQTVQARQGACVVGLICQQSRASQKLRRFTFLWIAGSVVLSSARRHAVLAPTAASTMCVLLAMLQASNFFEERNRWGHWACMVTWPIHVSDVHARMHGRSI
jgi:hypothetical protein